MRRDDIQFPPKHSALRDDVHVLGALIGEVLSEQGGDALFDLVENDRRPPIRRRAGDRSAAELVSTLARSRPQVARDLVRAFSTWFRVVNMAEKVHRIRRRRDYFLETANARSPAASRTRWPSSRTRASRLRRSSSCC